MGSNETADNKIILGDPVPWFSAPLSRAAPSRFKSPPAAGSVLAFSDHRQIRERTKSLPHSTGDAQLFDEDRLVFYGVLTAPPDPLARARRQHVARYHSSPTMTAPSAGCFGAADTPRTIVLDPMLRAVADIPWDYAAGHAQSVRGLLASLPAVDDSAGVPLTAPVLIVPRVFDFSFCDLLVQLYEKLGGKDSGFLLDTDGKTATVVDYRIKRRNDLPVAAPELRELVRSQIVRRLLPPIEQFFQFQATRMDRYIVSCYDSAIGGHFYRHRDNVNAGAQHRRFAFSLNLNNDYDGCDLVFPEFGSRAYRAPHGGAIVFSCGALHQVTPVTRGRRYAFLAFLYGEADAALRETNNALLHQGEARYSGISDHLFPHDDHCRERRAG